MFGWHVNMPRMRVSVDVESDGGCCVPAAKQDKSVLQKQILFTGADDGNP
jgi:hypothetical protein